MNHKQPTSTAVNLDEIKEEVAKATGFESWSKLHKGLLFKFEDFEKVIDIVSKIYANAKLDEAAENSQEMIYEKESEHSQKQGLVLRNFQSCYATAKQSILSLKDKI